LRPGWICTPDADGAIINGLSNEDGGLNRASNGTQVDNHNVLTGTKSQGALYSASCGRFKH